MRKIFWGLTAAALAAVGGMVWLKCMGPVLPFTVAAAAAIKCCEIATGGTVLGDADAGLSEEDLAEFIKPDDPAEDVATLKDPIPDPASTDALEFTPTPVVPAITIREPIEVVKSGRVADSGIGEFTTGAPIDAAILQANAVAIGLAHGREIQTAPRVMPYCQDDDTPAPRMEYAIEDDFPETKDFDDCSPGFWSFFFPAANKHTCNHGSASQGGAEDSEALPMPQRQTSLKSLREHLHKLTNNGETGPAFPAVDTMEFRPSDHSPYERNPNPL